MPKRSPTPMSRKSVTSLPNLNEAESNQSILETHYAQRGSDVLPEAQTSSPTASCSQKVSYKTIISPAVAQNHSEDMEPHFSRPPRIPIPNPLISLGNIPQPYILKQLLDFGNYFLEDEPTAQVFVEAVPLNSESPPYSVVVIPPDIESESLPPVESGEAFDKAEASPYDSSQTNRSSSHEPE